MENKEQRLINTLTKIQDMPVTLEDQKFMSSFASTMRNMEIKANTADEAFKISTRRALLQSVKEALSTSGKFGFSGLALGLGAGILATAALSPMIALAAGVSAVAGIGGFVYSGLKLGEHKNYQYEDDSNQSYHVAQKTKEAIQDVKESIAMYKMVRQNWDEGKVQHNEFNEKQVIKALQNMNVKMSTFVHHPDNQAYDSEHMKNQEIVRSAFSVPKKDSILSKLSDKFKSKNPVVEQTNKNGFKI